MIEQTQPPFTNALVIMTDRHIGNLLVSLYALKSVQQRLKQGQTLTCVVDFNLLSLAEYLLPEIEFIPFSLRGSSLNPLKKVSTFWRLLRTLRKKHYDVAVDLYGHGESLRLAKLSGASFISAFYCRPKLTSSYNWTRADSSVTPQHQLDFYRLPFYPIIGDLVTGQLAAPKHDAVLQETRAKLAQLGVHNDKPLIVIHPGAGKAYKFWPTRHWQSLIRMLEHSHHQVLLIGAGADADEVNAILSATDIHPINGYQKFSLVESIHLGFIAKCMVGNDSGPTHLIATTPTPVVSIFGPTDATLWAPLSPNSFIVRSETPCAEGCAKGSCQRDVSCLEALTPETVYEKLNSVVDITPSKSN
jgi:heptosyltransferase-3